jgi:zinc protease
MFKKLFLAVIFLTTLSQVHAESLIQAETFTLKNGLQFFLLVNKRAPIVFYSTWFKVGSADEVPGKTGLAHYLEHLMETGLPEVQMGQFLEDFQSSGSHSNAITTRDHTYYYKTMMTDHLELLMRYEAGRMRGVAFNQTKFDTEKNVILEERLMRTETNPDEHFNEKFNNAFFSVHPYKNPIIGWEKDIRGLTLDDVKAFHKKWYQPNNAYIIVSGDFDPVQVKTWAEKYYGELPSGEKVQRKRPEEPLKKVKIEPVVIEHPKVAQLSISEIYPLPDLKKSNYQDMLALILLAEFLEGDFQGSLYEILVHQKKLASSFASSSAFFSEKDPWSFAFYVKPTPTAKWEDIEASIHQKLEQIAREGVKKDDLKRARHYVYNELVMSLDDIYQKAILLGDVLSSDVTLEQLNALPTDLEKVTSEDIQRVVKAYLQPDKAVVGVLKKGQSVSPSKEKTQ